MAGERSRYFNVNVDIESTFATANGSPSYKLVPTREGTLAYDLRSEPLADDTTRNDVGEHQPVAGSKVNSTLNFGCHLHGVTRSTGTPQRSALGEVLLNFMGTEVIFDDDTTAGSITAGGFDLTTQSALNLTGVVWIGVVTPNNGTQWRPCTISSGTVTLLYDLPEAPASAATVYGTASYQLGNNVTEANSFQAQVLTDRADQKFLALGCMTNSATFTFGNRQLPTVDLANLVTDWTDAETDNPTNITPPLKSPWMGSHAILDGWGGTAYAAADEIAVKGAMTTTLTRGLLPRDDPNASQGSSMWDTPGDSIAEIAFQVVTDDRWRDEFGAVAGNYYHLMVTTGRTNGRTAGMYIAKCHQRGHPTPGDQGGIMTTNLTLALTEGYNNGGIVLFQG